MLRLTIGGDDYALELRAEVMANGFSGQGSAYFSPEQITDFATAIEAYPLPQSAAPKLVGGYWSEGQVVQEHLFLSIYPVGLTGYLGVRVKLATPMGEGWRPERRHAVEVELSTTYQELNTFTKDLRYLVASKIKSAVLPVDFDEN